MALSKVQRKEQLKRWWTRFLNLLSVLLGAGILYFVLSSLYSLLVENSQIDPAMITLTAVMVAVLVFLRQAEREQQNFYLAKTLEVYEMALEILNREIKGTHKMRRTNRRVDWIAAARTLEDGKSLSQNISSKHHFEAHFIVKNKFRLYIRDCLERDVDGSKISASFWYGGETSSNLDQAAKKSTGHDSDGQPLLENIPEKAIFLIHKFTEFPPDYDDPLDQASEFNARQLRFLHLQIPGLAKYLKHQDNYFSFDGELTPRNPPNEREEP